MTTLYIVRHAYAGQHGDPRYADDSLRPLTAKGRKQFRRVVKKLVRRGFAPKIVATSPLVRCRQTAEVICERISPPPPLVINQNLYPKLPFDPLQFIPLAVMGKVPNAILTNSPRLKDVKNFAIRGPGPAPK